MMKILSKDYLEGKIGENAYNLKKIKEKKRKTPRKIWNNKK